MNRCIKASDVIGSQWGDETDSWMCVCRLCLCVHMCICACACKLLENSSFDSLILHGLAKNTRDLTIAKGLISHSCTAAASHSRYLTLFQLSETGNLFDKYNTQPFLSFYEFYVLHIILLDKCKRVENMKQT